MRSLVLVLVLVLAAACGKPPPQAAPRPGEVTAVLVKGELPRADPDAAAWQQAPETVATLLLQDVADPKLATPGVPLVRVRALTDGKWIAFRLQWDDGTRDAVVGPARFGDAVAIQLPYRGGGDVPDPAMGLRGKPVRISVWKAALEARLRGGPDPVAALHPNAPPSVYPAEHMAALAGPGSDFTALYAPARAAGNPVAAPRPDSPTQDLLAEGFGSLTIDPAQVSRGRGEHAGGAWRVALSRPLDDAEPAALRPGARTYVAFAVWDGGAGNTGSRKMRTGWMPLALEPAP